MTLALSWHGNHKWGTQCHGHSYVPGSFPGSGGGRFQLSDLPVLGMPMDLEFCVTFPINNRFCNPCEKTGDTQFMDFVIERLSAH